MTKIVLRSIVESDLPILFQQQREPEAIAMSAYPSKDKGEFMLHWEKILKDKAVIAQAVIFKGKLAGHILFWKEGYEPRVGYWLGKEFWGRGIASAALTGFLRQVKTRPLYAHVAIRNIASRRVLEKCGFELLNDGPKICIFKLTI